MQDTRWLGTMKTDERSGIVYLAYARRIIYKYARDRDSHLNARPSNRFILILCIFADKLEKKILTGDKARGSLLCRTNADFPAKYRITRIKNTYALMVLDLSEFVFFFLNAIPI